MERALPPHFDEFHLSVIALLFSILVGHKPSPHPVTFFDP
jgi:hypothetical protein